MSTIERLSSENTRLERELAEYSGQYAELYHSVAPFLARFHTELQPYHEKLLEVRREIADLRFLQGDRTASHASKLDSPLTRLLDEDNLSVEEQFKRYGLGKMAPRIIEMPDTDPPSDLVMDLYTKIVANAHPLLASSLKEADKRRKYMKRADHAYIKRDAKALRKMATTFDKQPTNLPALVDDGYIEELRERNAKLEEAVSEASGQIFELQHGELARLKGYVDQAKDQRHDLIDELREDLKRVLKKAVVERDELRKKTRK
ncbi:MAG: hypothetical protein ACFB51_13100 [Anaerolineae bacterium]